jgi:hypothetical protein
MVKAHLLKTQSAMLVADDQGCQIFRGPNIPKREKYTKLLQTIPNGHKLYKIAVKYSKWS